jgi:Flp pilus assembly pilin Flp
MTALLSFLCAAQHFAMNIRGCWNGERGQTMVEYVMVLVLVALTVFLLTPNIKSGILAVFSNTSSTLS